MSQTIIAVIFPLPSLFITYNVDLRKQIKSPFPTDRLDMKTLSS